VRRAQPAARVEVFQDAGHALFVDEPIRFNALVRDFAADFSGRLAHPGR
jgi:pimeloyl-ACP methyl ester carboxylesterase